MDRKERKKTRKLGTKERTIWKKKGEKRKTRNEDVLLQHVFLALLLGVAFLEVFLLLQVSSRFSVSLLLLVFVFHPEDVWLQEFEVLLDAEVLLLFV